MFCNLRESTPLALAIFSWGGYPLGIVAWYPSRTMFGFFRLLHSDQRTIAFVLALFVVLLCWHTASGKQETFATKQYRFRIDLNTATLGELQTLPGIGPKLAESIIRYRDQHTPIDDFNEILNVSGIGPKRYSAMKPYFTD